MVCTKSGCQNHNTVTTQLVRNIPATVSITVIAHTIMPLPAVKGTTVKYREMIHESDSHLSFFPQPETNPSTFISGVHVASPG